MPDASLLTSEVRALVGRTSAPAPTTVTRKAVRRAMEVYGATGRRDFAPGDRVPGYVVVALEADSEPVDVPDIMPKSLLISNELEFERPLRLGEELQVSQRVADISERLGGRFGYSVYVRSDTLFHDGEGKLVARTARTMMYYETEADGGEE